MISQQVTEDLYRAILTLKTTNEYEIFFHDLLTEKELEEVSTRWQIVLRLVERQRKTYREIAAELGTSTATVGNVNQILNGRTGKGGYKLALSRISELSPEVIKGRKIR